MQGLESLKVCNGRKSPGGGAFVKMAALNRPGGMPATVKPVSAGLNERIGAW